MQFQTIKDPTAFKLHSTGEHSVKLMPIKNVVNAQGECFQAIGDKEMFVVCIYFQLQRRELTSWTVVIFLWASFS